jgi:hypothetical protein
MKMTYDEFVKAFDWAWDYPYLTEKDRCTQDKTKPRLSVQWITGGENGGSCWDTGETHTHYPIRPDSEPDMEDLDKILKEVAPSMTFLTYRKLAPLMKTRDFTDYEYYGNYTTMCEKYLEAWDLYSFLVDNVPEV